MEKIPLLEIGRFLPQFGYYRRGALLRLGQLETPGTSFRHDCQCNHERKLRPAMYWLKTTCVIHTRHATATRMNPR